MKNTKKYTIMSKKESKELYIRELAKIEKQFKIELSIVYFAGSIVLTGFTYILFI